MPAWGSLWTPDASKEVSPYWNPLGPHRTQRGRGSCSYTLSGERMSSIITREQNDARLCNKANKNHLCNKRQRRSALSCHQQRPPRAPSVLLHQVSKKKRRIFMYLNFTISFSGSRFYLRDILGEHSVYGFSQMMTQYHAICVLGYFQSQIHTCREAKSCYGSVIKRIASLKLSH
jgi:hypothetical protein